MYIIFPFWDVKHLHQQFDELNVSNFHIPLIQNSLHLTFTLSISIFVGVLDIPLCLMEWNQTWVLILPFKYPDNL